MTTPFANVSRCPWAGDDPLMIAYHDHEWGVPVHDDRRLFELLMLEGFQAGLAWITVLRKREAFRQAFDGWDPARIATFGPDDLARLAADPGIIRNRAKIAGAVTNARAFLAVQDEVDSFDRFVWSFAPESARLRPPSVGDIPSFTPEAERLSRELRRRGFTFVGPTICYAFMQSAGLVDDHAAGCFRAAARTV